MKTALYIYQKTNGKEPFNEWLNTIKDKVTKARIKRRIDRLYFGNEGEHKSVGNGVLELKLSFGSGYRVYYGKRGEELIILLMGGNKSTQSKDIKLAQSYWEDFKRCNYE